MPEVIQGDVATITVQAPSSTDTPDAAVFTSVVGYIDSYTLNFDKTPTTRPVLNQSTQVPISTSSTHTVDIAMPMDTDAAANQDELLELFLPGSFSGSLASNGKIQVNIYTNKKTAGNREGFSTKVIGSSFTAGATGGDVTTLNVTLQGDGNLVFFTNGA